MILSVQPFELSFLLSAKKQLLMRSSLGISKRKLSLRHTLRHKRQKLRY